QFLGLQFLANASVRSTARHRGGRMPALLPRPRPEELLWAWCVCVPHWRRHGGGAHPTPPAWGRHLPRIAARHLVRGELARLVAAARLGRIAQPLGEAGSRQCTAVAMAAPAPVHRLLPAWKLAGAKDGGPWLTNHSMGWRMAVRRFQPIRRVPGCAAYQDAVV